MTDPSEAAALVRAKLAAARGRATYRDGLLHAAEILRARVEATRLPECRMALLEALAVVDVLAMEPRGEP